MVIVNHRKWSDPQVSDFSTTWRAYANVCKCCGCHRDLGVEAGYATYSALQGTFCTIRNCPAQHGASAFHWEMLLRPTYFKTGHIPTSSLSCVRLLAAPWAVACQPPLSMGILQARILEWVAMPSSGGSSQPRDWTQVSHITGWFFTVWATKEAPCSPYYYLT